MTTSTLNAFCLVLEIRKAPENSGATLATNTNSKVVAGLKDHH